MPEFKVGDALQRIRRVAAGEATTAPTETETATAQPAPAPVVSGDLFTGQTAPAEPAAPVPSTHTPMPTGHLAMLAIWRRVSPRDAARWETLLHNAWMTGSDWYGTLCLFCCGGCRLLDHAEAGWALRFDVATADKLRATGDELTFGSEAEYRDWAGRALGPRKAEFAELLQLSSLGTLTNEDYGWAFDEAVRRHVG